MNKTRVLLLIILLLLSVSACSIGEAQENHQTPLDPADWPTPVPTQAAAAPTPFPKEAAEVRATEVTEVEAVEATATPIPATPTPQPTPTAPALTGVLTTYGLNVRSGPGANYPALVETWQSHGELSILAVDEAAGWLKVRTPDGVVGWVNDQFVDVQGDASQLENNPSEPVSNPARSGSGAPTAQEKLLIQLKSGGDIMLINQDGSGLRKLTTGIDPALSPDGSKVAFTRWDGAQQGAIWIINSDGAGENAIPGETKQVKSPSWSPDSRRIAVNFQEGGALESVSKCWNTRNGGDPPINYFLAYDIETVVKGFDQFGPLVFVCWKLPPDPHWKLRIVDAETGDYEDKPAGQYAFAPAWDPANDWRVVSVAGNGLIWTDVNRGVAEQLTDDPADRGPVFSPDGKYIAVTYWQHDHWEIHRLNADGAGRVRLTKTPLYAIIDGPEQANNASPAFSPDGSQIAFLTDRAGRWEVWVMNLDGSNQRQMFSDAVNDQLAIEYHGNDERSLGWGR